MIKEHERVILTTDIPKYGLKKGDDGTVVHVYPQGIGYEVEFFLFDSSTIFVVTLSASEVKKESM